ncbi:MAG: hypothetical protein CL569_16400 [Alphaproteobacteria bacterium]|nr:hypothetical protein [Alphaproteobacteria bacterium]
MSSAPSLRAGLIPSWRFVTLSIGYFAICVTLYVLADPACHIPSTVCSNDADHYGYRIAVIFHESGSFNDPNTPGLPWVFWPPGFALMYLPLVALDVARPLVMMMAFQVLLMYAMACIAREAAKVVFGAGQDLAFSLIAFNPLLLSITLVPQADVVYAVWMSGGLLSLLVFLKRGSPWQVLVAGICLGVAAYMRPGSVGLIYLLPVAVPLLSKLAGCPMNWRRSIVWGIASSILAMAIIAPWLWRQHELGQGFRVHGLITESELVLDSLDYLDPEHVGSYWPDGLSADARKIIDQAIVDYRQERTSLQRHEIDMLRRDVAMDYATSGVVPLPDALLALGHGFRRFMLSGGEGFLHRLVGLDGQEEAQPIQFYFLKVLSLAFSLTSRILGLLGLIWLIRSGRWELAILFGGLVLAVWAGTPFKGGPRYRVPVEIPLELLAVAGWMAVTGWVGRGRGMRNDRLREAADPAAVSRVELS